MLTTDDGESYLGIARRANQGEMVIACKNAGLSSHEITILKRG